MVKKKSKGGWSCTCKGYENRGICSHSLAVLMVESQSYNDEMLQDRF
ncbi:MAG: SWIM zinc finger family protein [Candidatus Bathyarchaeia archaeon]